MGNFIYWPRDHRKDDYYINKEGMYRLLFLSQHAKAKDFRRHCCNVLFPHVRQQFTNKIKEDHQQAIEEKNASIVNMNTWHCKRKEMCIKPSYKNVKIPSPILKHIMFLMREISVKATSSSLYGNIHYLPKINIMTCHIML